MVRGNWQRRVELNEARRLDAKQRKQRQDEKKRYKQFIQELWALLDRHNHKLLVVGNHKKYHLHVWTDSPPTHHLDNNHNDNEDGEPPTLLSQLISNPNCHSHHYTKKGGNNEPDDENHAKTKSGKRRGGGGGGAKSKQKLHPRSHQKQQQDFDEEGEEEPSDAMNVTIEPRMCRNQFFTGHCSGEITMQQQQQQTSKRNSKSSSSCQCPFHYPPNYPTLAHHLLLLSSPSSSSSSTATTTSVQQKQSWLKECISHHPSSGDSKDKTNNTTTTIATTTIDDSNTKGEDNDGSMELLHYISIPLVVAHDDENSSISISELVSSKLLSCGMGSIVYVCLDHSLLLYDRYHPWIIPSVDLELFLLGKTISTTTMSSSTSQAQTTLQQQQQQKSNHLPGSVLEYVLTFLPDHTWTTMRHVCHHWNDEIGRHSVHLWKHYLERRSWPMPTPDPDPTTTTPETPKDNDIDKEEKKKAKATLSSATVLFQKLFMSHYTAVKDVQSIQKGIHDLISSSATTSTTTLASPKKKLLLTSQQNQQQHNVAVRSFDALQGAPQYPNTCVAAHVWSPEYVLVAYGDDCTVRLFHASSSSSSSSSSSLLCREVTCQRLDPYQNTKKRSSRLADMALDDTTIGCLCLVTEHAPSRQQQQQRSSGSGGEASILVFTSRDDFLMGEKEDFYQVMDIGQAVLNFIIQQFNNDNDNHQHGNNNDDGMEEFRTFLWCCEDENQDNDNWNVLLDDRIEILVSHTLASCGQGQFLVEVSVSVESSSGDNNNDDEDEQQEEENEHFMRLLFRKMVLISARTGTVIAMCSGHSPENVMRPRPEDMTLTSCDFFSKASVSNQHRPCGHRWICASPLDPAIVFATWKKNPKSSSSSFNKNVAMSTELLPGSLEGREEIMLLASSSEDGWEPRPMRHRPLLAYSDEVIVADTIMQSPPQDENQHDDDDNNEIHNHNNGNDRHRNKRFKSFLSFLPFEEEEDQGYQIMPLDGNLDILSLIALRQDHILAIGRLYGDSDTGHNEDGEPAADLDDLDGHWFGERQAANNNNNNNRRNQVQVCGVVIDVNSRTEIQRICLLEDLESQLGRESLWGGELPIHVACLGDTVVAAIWWKGVVMAGQNIIDLAHKRTTTTGMAAIDDNGGGAESATNPSSKKKKKKKLAPKKGSKKDGFARGMSLRG